MLAAPVSFAGAIGTTPATPFTDPNGGNPLGPAQIAQQFVQLPLGTQKMLMKILMSQSTDQEKQDTTEQLDGIFSTLPPDVQKSLYAKWDALTDEQRIALKHMDPSTMKALLGEAFQAELAVIMPDTKPIKTAIEQGKTAVEEGMSLAEKSRAFVQKLLYHQSSVESDR